MAVLLPHAQLAVRKRAHPVARDAHGFPVLGAAAAPGPAYPGAYKEQPDGAYTMRLDPRLWPLEVGDEVLDDAAGLVWVIDAVRLHTVPGVSAVDFIGVHATRNPPKVP